MINQNILNALYLKYLSEKNYSAICFEKRKLKGFERMAFFNSDTNKAKFNEKIAPATMNNVFKYINIMRISYLFDSNRYNIYYVFDEKNKTIFYDIESLK